MAALSDEFVRWLLTEVPYTLEDLREIFPEVPEFSCRRTRAQIEAIRSKLISTFEGGGWGKAIAQ